MVCLTPAEMSLQTEGRRNISNGKGRINYPRAPSQLEALHLFLLFMLLLLLCRFLSEYRTDHAGIGHLPDI